MYIYIYRYRYRYIVELQGIPVYIYILSVWVRRERKRGHEIAAISSFPYRAPYIVLVHSTSYIVHGTSMYEMYVRVELRHNSTDNRGRLFYFLLCALSCACTYLYVHRTSYLVHVQSYLVHRTMYEYDSLLPCTMYLYYVHRGTSMVHRTCTMYTKVLVHTCSDPTMYTMYVRCTRYVHRTSMYDVLCTRT